MNKSVVVILILVMSIITFGNDIQNTSKKGKIIPDSELINSTTKMLLEKLLYSNAVGVLTVFNNIDVRSAFLMSTNIVKEIIKRDDFVEVIICEYENIVNKKIYVKYAKPALELIISNKQVLARLTRQETIKVLQLCGKSINNQIRNIYLLMNLPY